MRWLEKQSRTDHLYEYHEAILQCVLLVPENGQLGTNLAHVKLEAPSVAF